MPSVSAGASLSQLLQQFNSRNKPKSYSPAEAFSAPQGSKSNQRAQSLIASITASTAQQRGQHGFASKLQSAVGPASQ
jgi:hypothetical protein